MGYCKAARIDSVKDKVINEQSKASTHYILTLSILSLADLLLRFHPFPIPDPAKPARLYKRPGHF